MRLPFPLNLIPTTWIQLRWQLHEIRCALKLHRRYLSAFDFVPFSADVDVFIETGLGFGATLRAAVYSNYYRKIYSFEVNQELIDRVQQTLPRGLRHVHIRKGHSPDLLLECDTSRSTVFWLDAHATAPGVYLNPENQHADDYRYGQCPLLAELAAIRMLHWQYPPVIFIDDVLYYEATHYEGTYASGLDRQNFPTRRQILAALPPGYQLSVHQGRFYECRYVGPMDEYLAARRAHLQWHTGGLP